jgi:GTP-binding protein HflX
MKDASADEAELERMVASVEEVLKEIGADELPVELVLNKVDLVDEVGRRRLSNRFPGAPQVSAATGEGLEELKERLAEQFASRWEVVRLLVPYADGGALSDLYALGAPIEHREDTPEGVLVRANVPAGVAERFAPFATNGDRR